MEFQKYMENSEIKKEEVVVEVPSIITRIVAPHNKAGREVTEADIDRVVADAKVLYEICFHENGLFKNAFAMASPQIDDKDPLNFFVTNEALIVINPKITRHSNYLVKSKEGCMTFPNNLPIEVDRRQKIEVEYLTIMTDPKDSSKFTFSSTIKEKLSGRSSWIFQHEYDHCQGKLIYGI